MLRGNSDAAQEARHSRTSAGTHSPPRVSRGFSTNREPADFGSVWACALVVSEAVASEAARLQLEPAEARSDALAARTRWTTGGTAGVAKAGA